MKRRLWRLIIWCLITVAWLAPYPYCSLFIFSTRSAYGSRHRQHSGRRMSYRNRAQPLGYDHTPAEASAYRVDVSPVIIPPRRLAVHSIRLQAVCRRLRLGTECLVGVQGHARIVALSFRCVCRPVPRSRRSPTVAIHCKSF